MCNRMLMRMLTICLIVLAAPAGAGTDGDMLEFGERRGAGFEPANGDRVTIPFRLYESGRVRLELYSGDGDLVRAYEPRSLERGDHEWNWDGRDDEGHIVPDEAWHPVLICECASGRVTVDPRENSGGVPLDDLDVRLSADGTIRYRLPVPARTLVRVGISGGAMVRGLDAWSAHGRGVVRQAWDGMDVAGTDRILGHEDLTVLVRAFSLPDHSIVTSGNDGTDYRTWRERRGWSAPSFDPETVTLARDGRRVAREAGLPASMLRDPKISIRIVDGIGGERDGLPVIADGATFRVDMSQADRWLMRQSLYEVGFFLDYRFVSEEESGYTPLSWRWGGQADPGRRTMTVNVSGLWGQVGVATVSFIVPEAVGEH